MYNSFKFIIFSWAVMMYLCCFQLKRMSEHIYSKHLSDEASMPVNLDSSCRFKVLQAIKNPAPDMFKIQQQQVRFQMLFIPSFGNFMGLISLGFHLHVCMLPNPVMI